MNRQDILNKVLPFLQEIGIEVKFKTIEGESFLPGLSIENGAIIIDQQKLQQPGDILHEAAHIAIVPVAERAGLNAASIGSRKDNAAEEMMAIAWSYAAALHLQIDPQLVFHDEGYNGGGKYIADNFKSKNYFGLPMLQWIGLTADEKNAPALQVSPYPAMIKWMRD